MQVPAALLIAAIRRRLKQLVGVKVREHGLSPAQFWLLVRICEQQGLSLRELADTLYMDQPTASRVVSALVRNKLARMEDDPDDRRRSRIVPTARGRVLGQKLEKLAQETRAAVEAPFSDEERATFRMLLHKALDHVSAL